MTKDQHLVLMPPNWIGDVIMAQPALKSIATYYAQHGTAQISVCGRAWLKELLPYLGLNHAQYQSSIPAADTAFLFPNSFRSAWQCRQAGIKQIIGYRGQWRSLLLSRALPHRIDTLHQHHRLFHLDIAAQMNIPTEDTAVTLSSPAGDKLAGQKLMQQHGLDPERVICIAPGAQFGAAKCYPPDGFHAVVKQLADTGSQPLTLGMPEDHATSQQIIADITSPHWNAAGSTNMTEALQLISASKLMLCNDSGLMHVAAGLGIPTVTPFGATDPARTAPSGPRVNVLYQPADCSPCLQRECSVSGHPCMANITPTMLLDACRSMLADH
ncbi:lipopolysaccharide heptosyltransferase II [Mariprofundus sp. EBB-1]|uniref:lipopolysaccharide heptosyltransferase II n=1 Tax=Mariprofundus sp. EBB-1 TaxID=2650971 RepID=UPI000EF22CA4|nr:lipopolysaccharide heptosyltransferase II [Mariprofundus sp. EBB-1]RLL50913.1 lipopolysaccharide heptosyltransferase II [Mariprofundus sp. EBB-1]